MGEDECGLETEEITYMEFRGEPPIEIAKAVEAEAKPEQELTVKEGKKRQIKWFKLALFLFTPNSAVYFALIIELIK